MVLILTSALIYWDRSPARRQRGLSRGRHGREAATARRGHGGDGSSGDGSGGSRGRNRSRSRSGSRSRSRSMSRSRSGNRSSGSSISGSGSSTVKTPYNDMGYITILSILRYKPLINPFFWCNITIFWLLVI